MTRIAIVAESDDLRSALADALRASPDFDVVAVSESVAEVSSDAEVVVVARAGRAPARVSGSTSRDTLGAPMLTHREREILALLADGLGNKQIAGRLGISTNTVKTHLELLFEKLDVASRTEAVATAARMGLLLL